MPQGDDNKSRRDDCPFWAALRRSRTIDGKNTPAESVALRSYDHKRNAELVKKRALGSISSYNLYHKGDNDGSSEQDVIDFISSLNDNDFDTMSRLKAKKIKRADFREPLTADEMLKNGRYVVIDKFTGEMTGNGS